MTDPIEYAVRPGQMGLSFVAIAGLCLLCAVLWASMPGVVLLLLLPSVGICIYQMIVTPTYGLRMSKEEWVILNGDNDKSIPASDIAYMSITTRDGTTRAALMLHTGAEIEIPVYLTRDPLDLIREATNRGVPVRTS
ncbi:MAG: hypothetical protein AAF376_13140 [Pseudomonadota bacterium]